MPEGYWKVSDKQFFEKASSKIYLDQWKKKNLKEHNAIWTFYKQRPREMNLSS